MASTITRRKKRYRVNEISTGWNIAFCIILILLAIAFVAPVWLVLSVSFTSPQGLSVSGYQFWPSDFSTKAYEMIGKTGAALFNGYKITLINAFGGTALSLFVMSMFAYVLARKDFKPRRAFAFYAFFTTLFSGGMVPSYIINARYLHLNDTIWIYLLPGMVSAFNVIILRTFIQTTIPDSLFDAAKIDGATDWGVYWRIVLPLFKAGLATVGLFTFIGKWNDWFTGILYVENPKLQPAMTVLQKIQQNIDFLKNNAEIAATAEGMKMLQEIPSESTRMAITMIVIFPLLICYPFFQKYFVKGLTVGSVKG